MACGTGKTLTSLRLSEELCPGGTVLFLAPSISLVSQTMRGWVDQVRGRINPYVVCSDGKASKLKDDESYGQLSDIPYPATTNADTIASRFRRRDDALNVVFSTYQSIDVVARAQQLGLPDFDLIVCDEAHRTTGVVNGEGAFQKVHDNGFIHAAKRVYMTATPRIYDTSAKKKADVMGAVAIASMDDEKTYGRLCYTLGFGKAVEKGILTDYKIVVMNVGEDMLPATMQQHLGSAIEVKVDDQAKFIGIWKALFDRTHASGLKAMGRHAQVDIGDAKRLLRHAIAFASSIKASKQLSNEFQNVINAYTVALGEENREERDALMDAAGNVTFDVDHVDGGMDALTRADKLAVLAEDDGSCHICYVDKASGDMALAIIKTIVEGPQVGAIYTGKVVKIMDFGAFVELAPGKDGLCHISKLDSKRVNKVEDVVSLGDEITVKVMEIDRMGRINLSRKDAIKDLMNEDTELISAQ